MTNDDQLDYESDYPEEDTPTSYRTRPQQPPELGADGSGAMATPRRSMGETSGSTPARRSPPPLPEDDIPVTYSRPLMAPMEDDPPRRQPPVSPRSSPASDPRRSTSTTRPSLPQANVPPRVRSTSAAGQPKGRSSKRESGLYLPWWSLLILVVFVGAAAIGAWAVVGYLGGNTVPGGETPVVVVITSTFTVGPPATPTAIPAVQGATSPPALPTIAPTGTLPPGQFQIGARVRVIGVGEAGLNVRASPGTDGVVKFRALENEEFTLREQPQTASGREWWFVQSATDENRSGWASREYLEVITP